MTGQRQARCRRGARKLRKRRPAIGLEPLESRQLLAGDLVAHWRADDLNETLADQAQVTDWPDAIANANAALFRGSPTLAKGQLGGRSVVRFDATDANGIDSLLISIQDNPLPRAEDFSVVVVFATSSAALQGGTDEFYRGTGLVDADTLSFSKDWGVVLNQAGQVGVGLGEGMLQSTDLYSNRSGLNDGGLHTVAFTRAGDTMSLYVDEDAPQSRADADSGARADVQIAFGQLASGGGGYSGDLAEVRFYDGGLNAAEVTDVRQQILGYYDNSPPTAMPDSYTTAEDELLLFVPASEGLLQNDLDTEGDDLTAVLVEGPAHGSVTVQSDGSFVYNSDRDFFGEDTFSYAAVDFRASPPATVTLIVQPRYDPAVAVEDSYKGLAGQTLSIAAEQGVLANDQNPDQVALSAVLVDDVPVGQLTLQANGGVPV